MRELKKAIEKALDNTDIHWASKKRIIGLAEIADRGRWDTFKGQANTALQKGGMKDWKARAELLRSFRSFFS